ncbi:hypothetical protein CERSUDRAFT_85283 [Gelatoporia subvermispora B]|uniref:DUF6533 domain-containing protein n=1 Tax=Ceriporiopsis subvermispora (strain B) TaxID=914234 RepID=M2RA00_CERS8|nr:hypothetical protein CERSUDRAFT_85283 [Gelatoporia subvermispora B]
MNTISKGDWLMNQDIGSVHSSSPNSVLTVTTDMSFVGSNVSSEIVTYLMTATISTYCSLAGAVIVLFDHLETIPSEVEVIWRRKFSSVTLLFHFNRWTIFTWAALQFVGFVPWTTFPVCFGMETLGRIIALILFVNWAVFSAVRAYAVSGGSSSLAFSVLALSMVPVGTNSFSYFVSESYGVVDFPGIGAQCVTNSSLSELSIRNCKAAGHFVCIRI